MGEHVHQSQAELGEEPPQRPGTLNSVYTCKALQKLIGVSRCGVYLIPPRFVPKRTQLHHFVPKKTLHHFFHQKNPESAPLLFQEPPCPLSYPPKTPNLHQILSKKTPFAPPPPPRRSKVWGGGGKV